MLTLRQLVESTRAIRTRFNPTGRASITRLAPVPAGEAFAVQMRIEAVSDASMRYYDSTVVLFDIEYVAQKDPQHPLGVEVTPGQVLFFNRPSMGSTKAQCTCTCKNWYFQWQFYVDRAGSLSYDYFHGARYVRKTPPPPLGRPYQNPRRVPGVCKHIARLIQIMRDRGFLVN